MKDEFNLDAAIGVELDSWNDMYVNSGVYSAIFSELVCVVSKYPKMVHRNPNNDLHNVTGDAVEWGFSTDLTKFDCSYINGRQVPRWVINEYGAPGYFSKFLKEENEDIKAAIITLIKDMDGNEGLLKFLNASLVDEKHITHFEGYTETIRLYKTKERYTFLQDRNGKMNQPYCWSEMVCPSTGSTYLIDNSADFTCAIEAAKFLRPSFVPMELTYQWALSAN